MVKKKNPHESNSAEAPKNYLRLFWESALKGLANQTIKITSKVILSLF